MREHLYRGKRLNGGGWALGYYFRELVKPDAKPDRDTSGEGHWIITQARLGEYEPVETEEVRVIPETVGEWTGLLDKNRIKIFEGDIVRYKGLYLPVRWDIEKAGFFVGEDKYWMMNGMDIEVVGNIWDNSSRRME
jgi:hypothetical protein